MERPPRGRAGGRDNWCRCETPPAESQRSEPIPPLPSPKRSPLCRHRAVYIVSAGARLSPQLFHLKEEMGGREESAVRHPQRLPPGSCRLPSSAFTKPPSLPSARSCLLPGPLIVLVLPRKAELLFFPWRAGTVFARGGCRGPSGMSAPRGTQWNGRGRAEEPRVCRERGGGEAPGTSMSRLNIYPHIIVLCGSPPSPPRPGRAGRGPPGCRGTLRGRAQAAAEGPGVHPRGAVECGWGLPGPCNSMLGSVREGVVRHLLENCFLSFYFQFFYQETFKNDLHHKWSLGGRGGG